MVRLNAIARFSGRLLGAAALLGGLAAGGCADLMARSTIAPEWFQAKAVEVKGEGYPELAQIPQARGDNGNQSDWDAKAASLRAKAAEMEKELAELDEVAPTDEEIRATEAQIRARLESGPAPQ